MPDERDFDYGICKIPRKDKDGNDISNDQIGRGGCHRSNGTYSGAVYDVEVVDGDPSVLRTKTVYRDRPIIIEKKPSLMRRVVANLFYEHGEEWINRRLDIAEIAERNWWANRKERKATERLAKYEAICNTSRPQEAAPRLKADQVLREL